MRVVDWMVLGATLVLVVFYGPWRRRHSNNVKKTSSILLSKPMHFTNTGRSIHNWSCGPCYDE
jgi:hypothetical protein